MGNEKEQVDSLENELLGIEPSISPTPARTPFPKSPFKVLEKRDTYNNVVDGSVFNPLPTPPDQVEPSYGPPDLALDIASGGSAYVGGVLGKKGFGKAGEVVGPMIGAGATRVAEKFASGRDTLDEYQGGLSTLGTGVFDFIEYATGKAAAGKFVKELITPEIKDALVIAKNRQLIKPEAYVQALEEGVITQNTENAIKQVMFELELPEGAIEAQFRGEFGVKQDDTLRSSALRKEFKERQARIESLPEIKTSDDVFTLYERNGDKLEKLNAEIVEAADSLTQTVNANLPKEFRSKVYKDAWEKVPGKETLTPTQKRVHKVPQDIPGTISKKDIDSEMSELLTHVQSLEKSNNKTFQDAGAEIRSHLNDLYARFDNNDGLILPSEYLELNKHLNGIRRNVEKEFATANAGKLARGDTSVTSEVSEAIADLQHGLKNIFERKSKLPLKDGQTAFDAEDLKKFQGGNAEASARYTLDTTLEIYLEAYERGISTTGKHRVSRTAGEDPKASLITNPPVTRQELVSRIMDKMRTEKAAHDTSANLAERQAAINMLNAPLDNVQATSRLRENPAVINRPTGLDLTKQHGAGIAAAGALEAGTEMAGIEPGNVFGPGDVFAQMPKTSGLPTGPTISAFPEDQVNAEALNAQNDFEAAIEAAPVVTGPVDTLPAAPPEPMPPPMPEFDFPRNSKEFTDYITPDTLILYAPEKAEEYSQLLSSNPSEAELRQFIATFAAEKPELFEQSPVPGYRSIVDNKVTDGAEQELYREEVINKMEKAGDRIKAKSRFNRDYSIAGKPRRKYRRQAYKAPGSGSVSDTSKDREAAAEKRAADYQD